MAYVNLNYIKGKYIVSLEVNKENGSLVLVDDGGQEYILCHKEKNGTSVSIKNISGELNNIIGSKIIMAELTSFIKQELPVLNTYRLVTSKGSINIHWNGSTSVYLSLGYIRAKKDLPSVKIKKPFIFRF